MQESTRIATLEQRVTELESSLKSMKSLANGTLAIAVFALATSVLRFFGS